MTTSTIDGVMMYRHGAGLKLTGEIREGRVVFMGGKFGAHTVAYVGPQDAERALTHWEGYCEANGLGLHEGKQVGFMAGIRRVARVLVKPRATSSTVLVGGFRYKHGGMAKPRRIRKIDLYA